ncbi:hypothetical protein ACI3PL_20500, partial [Lacticaseibacillus paracasei]
MDAHKFKFIRRRKAIYIMVMVLSYLVISAFAFAQNTFAAAPNRGIGFQGQLFDNGNPVDASVSASFTFYDALSGGSV